MIWTRCIDCGAESQSKLTVDSPCEKCGGLVAFTSEAAEQNYRVAKQEYDTARDEWIRGGKVGSPPPRPIPPHTPGGTL